MFWIKLWEDSRGWLKIDKNITRDIKKFVRIKITNITIIIITIIIIIIVKKNWSCAMTRHHAEANINILLTRNIPFDSDVRHWSNHLVIPMHCLCAKLSNRARGQFSLIWSGLVLLLFWFCSFACLVQFLFHNLFTFSSCANKSSLLQNEY